MKQSALTPRVLLETLAPAGSTRRSLCNGLRRGAHLPMARYRAFMAPVREDRRHGRTSWQIVKRIGDRNWNYDHLLALATMPGAIVEPLTRHQMNAVLRDADLPRLRVRPLSASASVTKAARYAIARFLDDPALRRRYPDGLGDGPDGGLCAHLCGELKRRPRAVENLRAAFAHRTGSRIRQAIDLHPDWLEYYPLALTPAGSRSFLNFLLRTARWQVGFEIEEILWFHLENVRDPRRGTTTTYLRSPEWQARRPHGLSREGFPELLDWIADEYDLGDADWLRNIPAPVPPARPAAGPGVNMLAYFTCPSGLQATALSAVEALKRAGIPHGCRNVPVKMEHDLPERAHLMATEDYPVSVLHLSPIYDLAMHYRKASLYARPGVYRAGVWYWELEVIPDEWRVRAREFDEIWAPTQFIHAAMARVLDVPVIPMLPGVPTPAPAAGPLPLRFGIDPARFLFLFMFDMPSVMARKNPLAVIEAYRRAFGRARGTQLAIKVSRGRSYPEDFAKLSKAATAAGVTLIDEVLTRAESDALLQRCDAYVSLHRSEGLGLTLAESMLLGKPVIATAYSGNLDFTTTENSRLIPFEMVPVPADNEAYPKNGRWADPCVAAAAEAMKWIVDDGAAAKAMAERGRRDAQRIFSLDAYGERLRLRLEEIGRKRAGANPYNR